MIYGITKGTDFEKLCDGAAKAEYNGEKQVLQFAQAFRAAGFDEAADEMEIFAKQEAHHGDSLTELIEKYKNFERVER